MKYDLYFHNDFDGYASAAVFWAYLKSKGDKAGFFPIDHDIKPEWLGLKFKNRAAVFDFPYHPKATFWIDHHETTFFKPELRKKYRKTKFHQFDPKYYSCCHLVYDILKRDFGFKPPRHFRELVKWLDVIDSARYTTAGQEIEMKEPALQLGEFIDFYRGKKGLPWLVELLSKKPLETILRDRRVGGVIKKLKFKKAKDLAYYRKHLQVYGKVALINLAGTRVSHLGTAPFYLVLDLIYSVVLKSKKGGRYGISLRGNPFKRNKIKVHLGELLQKKSWLGGGHRGAAGCEVKSKKAAYKLADELVEYLRTASG